MIISFIYNNVPQKITMKLPLTINKFFEPTEMNGESFFARWKNLGGYIKFFLFLFLFLSFFFPFIKISILLSRISVLYRMHSIINL